MPEICSRGEFKPVLFQYDRYNCYLLLVRVHRLWNGPKRHRYVNLPALARSCGTVLIPTGLLKPCLPTMELFSSSGIEVCIPASDCEFLVGMDTVLEAIHRSAH